MRTRPEALLRTLAAPVLAVSLALIASSCGTDTLEPKTSNRTGSSVSSSAKALQEVAAETERSLDGQFDGYDSVYSDVRVTAVGENTLEFRYTYLETFTKAEAEAYFGPQDVQDGYSEMSEGVLRALRSRGVSAPEVRWIYLNPDGTELMTISRR